jgi:hypothetical protein
MKKMSPKEFTQYLEDNEIEIGNVNPNTIYDTYYTRIYPYLTLIGDFVARPIPATEKQIRRALGVGSGTWNACKRVFEEFVDYLGCKESFLQLATEIHIQKGLQATEYKQPKILEMEQLLYNRENYKPKDDSDENKIPTTIEVRIVDASVDEGKLEEEEK